MNTYRDEIELMDETELMELLVDKGYEERVDEDRTFDSYYVIEIIEYMDGEVFDCREADVLDSIMNGNWNDAVEMMQDIDSGYGYMFPSQIADYIEDRRYEEGEELFEFFDLGSMSALCDVFYTARERERRSA